MLLRGLKDESDWVRSCAQETVEDINHYMGWKIGSAKANKEREKSFTNVEVKTVNKVFKSDS
ncbi:hypothetical protein N474_21110 [Pseudoalteromonas luteoviolacea CPMOR-2]|nr:hypothetical protein N474_21110 [Pseudoalteromonas luteoviolacea CPMOR-2]